jgi:hypothetical protein
LKYWIPPPLYLMVLCSCKKFLFRIIEGFPRRYHLRYYLIWIDYSDCLNGIQLISIG